MDSILRIFSNPGAGPIQLILKRAEAFQSDHYIGSSILGTVFFGREMTHEDPQLFLLCAVPQTPSNVLLPGAQEGPLLSLMAFLCKTLPQWPWAIEEYAGELLPTSLKNGQQESMLGNLRHRKGLWTATGITPVHATVCLPGRESSSGVQENTMYHHQ